MTLDLDKGCDWSANDVRDVIRPLAEHYAPTLTFDPAERFFPVDLPSTAAASSLHRMRPEIIQGVEKYYPDHEKLSDLVESKVTPAVLQGRDRKYFTSACDWGRTLQEIQPSYYMPSPCSADDIAAKYAGPNATIDATLTMYATVCRSRQVPNYHELLERGTNQLLPDRQLVRDPEVNAALNENGLLINYYFYFPAGHTSWLHREGDWAGLSILVDQKPPANQPERAKPVLLCYYKKVRNIFTHWEYFVPGASGFVAPGDVVWLPGPTPNVASSPWVLISLGRHNCYPSRGAAGTVQSWTNSNSTPWSGDPESEKIEKGGYKTPTDTSVVGTSGWDEDDTWALLGLLFPPLWLNLCPARGKPRRAVQKNETDVNKPGGPDAGPVTGGAAPQPGYSTKYRQVTQGAFPKIQVVYVDTNDQATRDYWSYHGSWGTAELEQYPFYYEGSENEEHVIKSGRYGGAWRPNLAAWFIWNLFFDRVHGAGDVYYHEP